MTDRASFSDAEWELIHDTLIEVGLVATALDAGAVSGAMELKALIKAMMDAQTAHQGVELIAALVAEAEKNRRNAPPTSPPEEGFVEGLLGKVPEAVRLVVARATSVEAEAYQRLLRELARATTEAAGSGLFGTGEKVSSQEREFLRRLDAAIEAGAVSLPSTEAAVPPHPSTVVVHGRAVASTMLSAASAVPGTEHGNTPPKASPEAEKDALPSTVPIVGGPLTVKSE